LLLANTKRLRAETEGVVFVVLVATDDPPRYRAAAVAEVLVPTRCDSVADGVTTGN
jgi:hypothetical protein